MITRMKGTAISVVHVRTSLVITLEAAANCSSVRFFVRGLERRVASISQSKSTTLKYQNVAPTVTSIVITNGNTKRGRASISRIAPLGSMTSATASSKIVHLPPCFPCICRPFQRGGHYKDSGRAPTLISSARFVPVVIGAGCALSALALGLGLGLGLGLLPAFFLAASAS